MTDELPYSIFNQPGRVALDQYLGHKSGIDLFRAYVQRREADKIKTKNKISELIKRMEAGIPISEFDEAISEVLHYRILEELDFVVQDLLRCCENSQTDKDAQLVNLNSALRIGKHHSPHDAELAKKRWECVQGWIDAYLRMQETQQYESQSSIAKQLAASLGISKTTAINYWVDKMTCEPIQKHWRDEIVLQAKLTKTIKIKKHHAASDSKKASISTMLKKPKSWR